MGPAPSENAWFLKGLMHHMCATYCSVATSPLSVTLAVAVAWGEAPSTTLRLVIAMLSGSMLNVAEGADESEASTVSALLLV